MTGPGKRKRETLEELLARPWCYYCNRDFDDQQVLQTHQREMHFHCEHCSRRLNTANGLTVHTQQVHKAPVTRIRNAIEGRESPSIEVFGVRRLRGRWTVGIPQELVLAHEQDIIDGYYQRAAQHRARTGNPLPGTVKHDPNKKGKREETPAEMKARLAARLAEKKAQREAAARGEQSSQTPELQTPAESNTSPPAALQPMQTDAYVAPGMNHLPSVPFQPTLPVPHDIAAFQPQQPMMSVSPPNMSNGHPYGYPQGYPPISNYGPGFYSHQMPAIPNTQVPSTSTSPHNMYATHFPMPSAPGLPQRPSFDAPALSRTEMAHLHPQGQQHALGVSTSAAPPPPPAREATPPPPPPPRYEIRVPHDLATGEFAVTHKIWANDHFTDDPKTVGDLVKSQLPRNSNSYFVWFNTVPTSFEEVKAIANTVEFEENASPTETAIAR